MTQEETILYYEDDFEVFKRDNKYYYRSLDKNDEEEYNKEYRVKLAKIIDEETIKEKELTEDDLLAESVNYDIGGEYFFGTDYLYFKLIKGEEDNGRND